MPTDALIAIDGPTSAFLSARITALYGRQFELHVSVSAMSLQKIGIIYQVDTVIGTADMVHLPSNSTTTNASQAMVLPTSSSSYKQIIAVTQIYISNKFT